jgi:dTDP-4-dehydrorhamnose reductase
MGDPSGTPPLEMWAGIECTVNRVGDRTFDQLARSGHDRRDEDLGLIASLGVTTVRYPVLWERTAPARLEAADWRWSDARLIELRELGIQVIAGLVHHGSGPAYTSLVDPMFPVQLARYAGAVAARYPWLTSYTPVNEPLTTARFAGLYGHWYPHGREDRVFVRCLLTQCRATVLAMQAIREVTPGARLVFTEDLGLTQSTPILRYQAEFENLRRWLSLDLVCGRVDPGHPLRGWLVSAGVTEAELDWFRAHPCPPDLIGCNYYVTSERYLDHQLASWPAETHGGNHHQRYADVAAVRACGLVGIERLLHDVRDRFARPIAITEAHLGCTREQQLRWLVDVHAGATRARASGVDVWHNLVTRDEGVYEPGVFDVRGPTPRATALAEVIRALAAGRQPTHPALHGPGWWHARPAARRAA